jgi:hypothetical protein
VGDFDLMDVLGVTVVEVGEGEGEFVVVARGIVDDGVLGFGLGDIVEFDVEAVDELGCGKAVGKGFAELNFDDVALADGVAVVLWPADEHFVGVALGVDGAGEGGEVAGGVGEGVVGGGAEFFEADFDGGGASGGDVDVIESPFVGEGAFDAGIGRAADCFNPSAVAVVGLGDGIVVVGVAIGDAIPDFGRGVVGSDNDSIGVAADGVAVGGGEDDLSFGTLGVVVEGLGEGVVDGGALVAFEKGSCLEEVESFGEAGEHGAVVIVGAVFEGGEVEVVDVEEGFHLFFDGDVGGTVGEDAGGIELGAADFVAEFSAGRESR